MMKTSYKNLLVIFIFIKLFSVNASEFDFHGQLSGSLLSDEPKPDKTFIGLRYLPEVSAQKNLNDRWELDVETSANLYVQNSLKFEENVSKLNPYRLWIRIANDRFVTRLGLQKIDFGSAMLLRPLRWFDQIDPRDPLQITNGVYAVLCRFYFLNNANFWFWGIYGENEPKGLEVLGSEQGSGEFGGRIQFPLLKGEIAGTFHKRNVEYDGFTNPGEHRFAIDGKWDLGIGFWFEVVFQHDNFMPSDLQDQKMLNIGSDYTFGLGNGLHLLGEYFKLDLPTSAFQPNQDHDFCAILLDYPLSLFDQLTSIVYCEMNNYDFYRYVSWRRTYDNWSFNLNFFWNPENNNLIGFSSSSMENQFSGKGLLFMAVFNH